MDAAYTREELLETLTECHEADPGHFVTLPKQILDSSQTRMALADLRNEGYVEEQVRGVVRLTRLGYALRQRNLSLQKNAIPVAV
jgi:hypothetical protein